ncbi:hypothetical protein HDU96_003384 [Phlyctochytrium bullatum]|nr:hypothetical protein HDU96_003384 [Phlyctochytrium bullatum]
MVQGALAAYWAFRNKGKALAVAEAIQSGYPAIVFKTSDVWADRLVVLVVPVIAALLSVIYKFGITVKEADNPWSGYIRTGLMDYYMDQRKVTLETCQDQYAACKSRNLDPTYGIITIAPDLEDYSFLDGVQFGKAVSPSAYRLDVGDVPSVSNTFRASIRGGIFYNQIFIRSSIDCGRNGDNPWDPPSCPAGSNIIGPDRLPSPILDVRNVTLCDRSEASQIRGVVTFANSSLDVSCLFNMTVSLRDVAAEADQLVWKVRPLGGGETPIGDDNLRTVIPKLAFFIPRSFPNSVSKPNENLTCFRNRVCKQQSRAFAVELGSYLIQQMDGWTYQFLQWNKNPLPPGSPPEEYILPIPGRLRLSYPAPWYQVMGPDPKQLNLTVQDGAVMIVGANAKAKLVRATYVAVEPWLLLFCGLVVLQVIAAALKVKYQCHPLEPVAGLTWALRKLDPDVAKEVHGMRLAEFLEFTENLELTKDGYGATGVSIRKREDRFEEKKGMAMKAEHPMTNGNGNSSGTIPRDEIHSSDSDMVSPVSARTLPNPNHTNHPSVPPGADALLSREPSSERRRTPMREQKKRSTTLFMASTLAFEPRAFVRRLTKTRGSPTSSKKRSGESTDHPTLGRSEQDGGLSSFPAVLTNAHRDPKVISYLYDPAAAVSSPVSNRAFPMGTLGTRSSSKGSTAGPLPPLTHDVPEWKVDDMEEEEGWNAGLAAPAPRDSTATLQDAGDQVAGSRSALARDTDAGGPFLTSSK